MPLLDAASHYNERGQAESQPVCAGGVTYRLCLFVAMTMIAYAHSYLVIVGCRIVATSYSKKVYWLIYLHYWHIC